MATILPNAFTSYNLSPEELTQGSILTSLQKQCIQNQVSEFAIKLINLKYDPINPQSFLQEEAELQGNLNALQYLITLSDSAELALNQASLNL